MPNKKFCKIPRKYLLLAILQQYQIQLHNDHEKEDDLFMLKAKYLQRKKSAN